MARASESMRFSDWNCFTPSQTVSVTLVFISFLKSVFGLAMMAASLFLRNLLCLIALALLQHQLARLKQSSALLAGGAIRTRIALAGQHLLLGVIDQWSSDRYSVWHRPVRIWNAHPVDVRAKRLARNLPICLSLNRRTTIVRDWTDPGLPLTYQCRKGPDSSSQFRRRVIF